MPDTNDAVVQIAGNVGGEPEPGTTKKGDVVRFSVAVTKSYKNKLTTWVKITVFNDGLRAFSKQIHKGTPVVAEGYMQVDTYNNKPQFSLIAYRLGIVNYGASTKRESSGPVAESTAQPVQGW